MTMQWHHFKHTYMNVRISVRAADENTARESMNLVLRPGFHVKKEWEFIEATYLEDGSSLR